MNKKILSALFAVILLIPVTANAAQLRNNTVAQPTIAILDTAIDTSVPSLKDRVIFEACVIQWSSCPNGTREMEGKNSAFLPFNFISKNGFDHGTLMASVAVKTNPNVNIVFVRIIGNNAQGFRQSTGEQSINLALDWVIRNQSRLNIQAVSLSQGHHQLGSGTDYCPKTPITESKINQLITLGVPVVLSAGNNRDYSRIDWPACIPSAIAVGATMPTGSVAIYTNHDPNLTDFFALGTHRVSGVANKPTNIAGTSASTAVVATLWATIKASKPNLSYSEIYDLISRTSKPTSNSKIKSGKLIDLDGAFNG